MPSTASNASNTYDVLRNELFRDYELMDADSIISSGTGAVNPS